MSTPFDAAFQSHVDFCRSRVWSSIYRPIYETNPPLPTVPTVSNTQAPSGILLVDAPLAEDSGDESKPLTGLIKFRQKRSADDLSWEQQLNSQRIAAIRKWVQIILISAIFFR